MIHNDCYRSIINKFFEFYDFKINNEEIIDKNLIIEKFKQNILEFLNEKSSIKKFDFSQIDNYNSEFKFKYYQGMNDLIIFFVLLENSQYSLHEIKNNDFIHNKNNFKINKEIKEYITNNSRKNLLNEKKNNKKMQLFNNEKNNFSFHFNSWKFLNVIFNRNFEPFCFVQTPKNLNKNDLPNENINCNSLGMRKILPTLVKYIEFLNPKVKKRLFDLNNIEPFYSLSWILTWFSHNNENIFKNFRIFDYLIFGDVNAIFYLCSVVRIYYIYILDYYY